MPDWTLELSTSGGFAGRGVGRLSLDASRASDAVARAVGSAQPGRWKSAYSKGKPGADGVLYRLTLAVSGTRYATSWSDGDETKLPSDLLAIFEAISISQ